MIELFKDNDQKKQFVSTHADPFKSDKIEEIVFTIEKSGWGHNKGQISYKSRISFKNGDTSGWHRIESDDFVSLIQLTETFIKNL